MAVMAGDWWDWWPVSVENRPFPEPLGPARELVSPILDPAPFVLTCAIRGCDETACAVWMGFSVCKAHLERAQGSDLAYDAFAVYQKLCVLEDDA